MDMELLRVLVVLLIVGPLLRFGWRRWQDWGDDRHDRRQRNDRRF